ncbi:uroporphyrinogen-III synthase [Arenibacter sp. GZD96]|uniref:uroporphyrinogen-III synthase n=1 Tax=Aurantibrevibacter litoralis TaxID=3106030 RepID=UPI002AFEF51A|nr:uroporphyrinogen-III synthase [Arenibacter sp. GZD-96]MEA1785707.1 uroporphyrinogen-III synthase [Arenibacter sp. GZD-96]
MCTKLLSTKILSDSHKEPLIKAGFSLEMYDAIRIHFVDFQIEEPIKNTIFTSQNAVHAVLKRRDTQHTTPKSMGNCFCVGQKTKDLLVKHNFQVVEMAKNANELASVLIKKYHDRAFTFITGTMRRAELPLRLKEAKIKVNEITAYKTLLNLKGFHTHFDGVLFFSPSAVESYFQQNTLSKGMAFCIGQTTAHTAKKYTSLYTIATESTIEKVVQSVINHFKISG